MDMGRFTGLTFCWKLAQLTNCCIIILKVLKSGETQKWMTEASETATCHNRPWVLCFSRQCHLFVVFQSEPSLLMAQLFSRAVDLFFIGCLKWTSAVFFHKGTITLPWTLAVLYSKESLSFIMLQCGEPAYTIQIHLSRNTQTRGGVCMCLCTTD